MPGASQDPKKNFKKFVMIFIAILLAVFIFLLFLSPFLAKYQAQQRYENVKKVTDEMKKYEDQQYQLALKDTYGGKNPQETLRMYIDAVEKGDYQLASKYFILDKQAGELKSYDKITKDFLDKYINLLNEAYKKEGEYSLDKKAFGINQPILINMVLYPSGVWKIVEI